MCPGNFARQIHVIIGDVRLWVPRSVLELHFQTTAELVEIDLCPIDAEFAANPLGRGGTYPLSFTFHGSVFSLFNWFRHFQLELTRTSCLVELRREPAVETR